MDPAGSAVRRAPGPGPQRPSLPRRAPTLLLVFLLLTLTACNGGDRKVTGLGEGQPRGHAAIRFSGAVTGTLDADVEVVCFAPEDEGDPFSVSMDADAGVAVGSNEFLALDLSIPSYGEPRTYDLGRALAEDEDFDADDFLLIFQEHQEQPFGWGGPGSAGTVTIDEGERSGRVSLRGWRNGAGAEVQLDGSFRCGTSPGRQ